MLNLKAVHDGGTVTVFEFEAVAANGRPLPPARNPGPVFIAVTNSSWEITYASDYAQQFLPALRALGMIERVGDLDYLRRTYPINAPGLARLYGDIARRGEPHDCDLYRGGDERPAEYYSPEGVYEGVDVYVCPHCRGLVTR